MKHNGAGLGRLVPWRKPPTASKGERTAVPYSIVRLSKLKPWESSRRR